jgi:hypothetical protein
MRKLLSWLLISVIIASVACKKSDTSTPNPPPVDTTSNPPATTLMDKILDTAYAYSQDIYLWYKTIPDTINNRRFADPDGFMTYLRKYSIEPGFSQPVDKWSFGIKQVDWDNLSSGVTKDFGFSVFFFAQKDLRVKYVEESSPAGIAGIKRGWQITKINGSVNIDASNQASIDYIIQTVFQSDNTTFTFKLPDGSTKDVSLTSDTYQEHPIFLDTVYNNVGGKTVGYMVLNSFLGDTIEIRNEFNRIFTRFANANVNDVVIDLRYNGGGYVNLSAMLADYLVPPSANGQVLLTQTFNDKYTSENQSINVAKLGSLNLSRVFFIMTGNTASASELVINNMKPYVDVKLIGENSYGKPVGYFPIPISSWYIFPISFRTTNKAGQGNYFGGFVPDKQVNDGLDKDWGDINEACLASALKYIGTGAFRSAAADAPYIDKSHLRKGNDGLSGKEFKGMVANRHLNLQAIKK